MSDYGLDVGGKTERHWEGGVVKQAGYIFIMYFDQGGKHG